jgi:hypothetical protein
MSKRCLLWLNPVFWIGFFASFSWYIADSAFDMGEEAGEDTAYNIQERWRRTSHKNYLREPNVPKEEKD